jgi:hypothetical protein
MGVAPPACNPGSYSNATASQCFACPANSVSVAGADTCNCTGGYSTVGFGISLTCPSKRRAMHLCRFRTAHPVVSMSLTSTGISTGHGGMGSLSGGHVQYAGGVLVHDVPAWQH